LNFHSHAIYFVVSNSFYSLDHGMERKAFHG
jgi:hypothetical protein